QAARPRRCGQRAAQLPARPAQPARPHHHDQLPQAVPALPGFLPATVPARTPATTAARRHPDALDSAIAKIVLKRAAMTPVQPVRGTQSLLGEDADRLATVV